MQFKQRLQLEQVLHAIDGGKLRQEAKAVCAACTAASTSAAEPGGRMS